jgi:hypothetical protein
MIDRNAPSLVVRLRGGLGNQLFEYAAGRALALRNHVPLLLDTSSGFCGDPYGRHYELGSFNIQGERIEQGSLSEPGIRADLFRKFAQRRELLRIRVLGRNFDPAIYNLRIKGTTVLDTYCQSPRYFCEAEELVRKELEFQAPPPGLSERTVEEITQGNSVCLHSRQSFAKQADGSIRQSVADFYGTCDLAYYRRAIRELATTHRSLTIFVFSDDLRWAQQNAGAFEAEGCNVNVINDDDPLRNFYLMRLCKHFIIANSTFSWWAAWLGKYPMKTVCVPPVWNRGDRRFPHDLFPPTWRIISATETLAGGF